MYRSIALLLVLLAPLSARAQTVPDYLDDRSTPGRLVESLYNAISRKEFARAWGYFATPPAASVEAYAAGFEDTAGVEVTVGTPHEEGAAGSVYYELPVALSAERPDGTYRTFAGCYTVRLVQPANQEPPFRPMAIERGSLSPTETPYEEALPTRCGDVDLPAHDAARAKADAVFEAAYGDTCLRHVVLADDEADPQEYELTFRPSWAGEDGEDETFRLFRYFCTRGAYNETHIHLMAGYDGEVEIVSFAVPEADIRYVDDDSDGDLESMELIGFSARAQLVNSAFDPETRELTANGRWRGLGDASDSGLWIFRDGTFDLVRFEIDPTYDGEINPVAIFDVNEAP